MANILLNWLDDLKISRKVTKNTLESDFSNGYLFGEILSKYQMIDHFNKFLDGEASEDIVNNYDRLQPKFTLLRVPFDINIVTDIIFKKSSAASQTLFHLYTALENARKQGLTLALLKINQAQCDAKKQIYDYPIFKDLLRRRLPSKTEIDNRKLHKKFEVISENREKAAQSRDQKNREIFLQEKKEVYLKTRLQRDERAAKHDEWMEEILDQKMKEAERKKAETKFQRKCKEAMNKNKPKVSISKDLMMVQNLEQFDSGDLPSSSKFENRLQTSVVAETPTPEKDYHNPNISVSDLKNSTKVIQKQDDIRENRRRKYLYNEFKKMRETTGILRQNQMVDRLLRPTYQEQRIASYMQQILNEKTRIIKARHEYLQKSRRQAELAQQQEELRKQADDQREKNFIGSQIDRVLADRISKQEMASKAEEDKRQKEDDEAQRMEQEKQSRYSELEQLSRDIEVPEILKRSIFENANPSAELLRFDNHPIIIKKSDSQSANELTANNTNLKATKSKTAPNSKVDVQKSNLDAAQNDTENGEKAKPETLQPAPLLLDCNSTLEKCFKAIQPKEKQVSPYLEGLTKCLVRAAVVGPPCVGKSKLIKEMLDANQKMHHITIDSAIAKFISNLSEKEGDQQIDDLQLNDQKLAEIICESISTIPKDHGFIIESFPVNASQASHFEKLLTGNGMDRIPSIELPTFDSRRKIHENDVKNLNRTSGLQEIIFIKDETTNVLENLKNFKVYDLNVIVSKLNQWENDKKDLREFYQPCAQDISKENFTLDVLADSIYKKARAQQAKLEAAQETFALNTSEIVISAASNIVLKELTELEDDQVDLKQDSEEVQKQNGSSTVIENTEAPKIQVPETPITRTATPDDVDWSWPFDTCDKSLAIFQNIKDSRNLNLTECFADILSHHQNLINFLAIDTRQNFERFLARPDSKQEFVVKFQNEYNEMTAEDGSSAVNWSCNRSRNAQMLFRADDEVKAEWHLKRRILKSQLSEMIDKRQQENWSERTQLFTANTFLEQIVAKTNNICIRMSSVEYMFAIKAAETFLRHYLKLIDKENILTEKECALFNLPEKIQVMAEVDNLDESITGEFKAIDIAPAWQRYSEATLEALASTSASNPDLTASSLTVNEEDLAKYHGMPNQIEEIKISGEFPEDKYFEFLQNIVVKNANDLKTFFAELEKIVKEAFQPLPKPTPVNSRASVNPPATPSKGGKDKGKKGSADKSKKGGKDKGKGAAEPEPEPEPEMPKISPEEQFNNDLMDIKLSKYSEKLISILKEISGFIDNHLQIILIQGQFMLKEIQKRWQSEAENLSNLVKNRFNTETQNLDKLDHLLALNIENCRSLPFSLDFTTDRIQILNDLRIYKDAGVRVIPSPASNPTEEKKKNFVDEIRKFLNTRSSEYISSAELNDFLGLYGIDLSKSGKSNNSARNLPNLINHKYIVNFDQNLKDLLNSIKSDPREISDHDFVDRVSKLEVVDPSSILRKRMDMYLGNMLNSKAQEKYLKRLVDEIVSILQVLQDFNSEYF